VPQAEALPLQRRLRDVLIEPSGRFPIARWAPIPLRLIVGIGFMQHGFAKLSRGPEAFAAILQALAVPAPHLMAWVNILTELAGGLAILLGAFIVVASVPMAVLLLTAIFTVHWQYGFLSIKLMAVTAAGPQFGPPGYELDLLYLACLAALVLGGSGPLSIDGTLRRRWAGGYKSVASFANAIRQPISLSAIATPGGSPSWVPTTSVPPSSSASSMVIFISPRRAGSSVSNSSISTIRWSGTSSTKRP
jgi:putative oxidoreductase